MEEISLPPEAIVALNRGRKEEAIRIVSETYDVDPMIAEESVEEYLRNQTTFTQAPIDEEKSIGFVPILAGLIGVAIAAMIMYYTR